MANRRQAEMSRAEQVRARRQKSRKEAPRVPFGSSVTRRPAPKNVTVTHKSTRTVPVVTRKKHTTTIPLKRKGAELQIPALPRLQFGWRLISGGIFLLSLAAVISFSSLNTFQVTAVNLKGAQRLSAEVILSQLDLVGKSIITLEPEGIKDRVEANFPGIRSAQVTVNLPARVTIQVEEREPIILWEQEGSSMWIDAEGVVFPIFGEAEIFHRVIAVGDPPPEPEISITDIDADTGEFSQHFENRPPRTTAEFVETMISLSTIVPEGSQLQYHPQFGLGWHDPQGWMVYFGQDTTNIDSKLTEYQSILSLLNQQGITPALISLEFIHAPFYRMEQ
jgi:hypothetical protein